MKTPLPASPSCGTYQDHAGATKRHRIRSTVREAAVTSGRFGQGRHARAGCYDAPVEIVERTDELVTLTESAAAKIRGLMAEEPDGEASVLRVAVQGGGCSGFEYALG